MKKTLFYLPLIFFVFSCKNLENPGKKLSSGKSIKILNWNLETFFDGEFDGNEYKEFSCESYGWNKEKYIQRLERLAKVIKQSDADIVIMQEVEKKSSFMIFTTGCVLILIIQRIIIMAVLQKMTIHQSGLPLSAVFLF